MAEVQRRRGVLHLLDIGPHLILSLGLVVVQAETEGAVPTTQLVYQHAYSPDIHCRVMLVSLLKHFRGQVIQSPAKGGPLERRLLEVAPPEVTQLDVHVGIQQDVLGLDVPVDDSFLADILDGQGQLVDEVLGLLLG